MTCCCASAGAPITTSPPAAVARAAAPPPPPAAAGGAGAPAGSQASAGVAALGGGAPTQLRWPVQGGRVTDVFGSHQSWRTEPHTGVDIGAVTGTPILAAAPGVVAEVKWQPGGGGNMTVVRHAGDLSTVYAHQSRVDVAVGQHVAGGQVIGAVGATGNTTGPHLHFEVKRGSGPAVDPAPYVGI